MRRLCGVALLVALAVPPPAVAQSQPVFRLPLPASGTGASIACAPLETFNEGWRFYGGLSAATLLMFQDEVHSTGFAHTVVRDPQTREPALCVAAFVLDKGATSQTGRVTTGPAVPSAKVTVDVTARSCPRFKVKQGGRRCTPGRVTFVQIFESRPSQRACNIVTGEVFPFNVTPRNGGPNWKGTTLAGRSTGTLKPGAVVPALLESICGAKTARTTALERALGGGARKKLPAASKALKVTITPLTNERRTVICIDVKLDPPQVGERADASIGGLGVFASTQTQRFLAGRTARFRWPIQGDGSYFVSVRIGAKTYSHRGVLDGSQPALGCV
jgi:hypothetical protein